jgi:protein-tyrosine phosphatase
MMLVPWCGGGYTITSNAFLPEKAHTTNKHNSILPALLSCSPLVRIRYTHPTGATTTLLCIGSVMTATSTTSSTTTTTTGTTFRGTITTNTNNQHGTPTLFNFGPASDRDTVLYTAERPGGDHPSLHAIKPWINFVKTKGITDVLVLLDDNELEQYENSVDDKDKESIVHDEDDHNRVGDGSPSLLAMYEQHGLTVHRVAPMSGVGACTAVQAIVQKIMKQQEQKKKIVAHCTHGYGRSGRVAAGWLVMQYGLSPDKATEEVMATAQKYGVERLGDTTKLKEWLLNV